MQSADVSIILYIINIEVLVLVVLGDYLASAVSSVGAASSAGASSGVGVSSAGVSETYYAGASRDALASSSALALASASAFNFSSSIIGDFFGRTLIFFPSTILLVTIRL